ncbi:hypothetical protein HAP47_0006535 [Bradyrhizobium sp. 41S5]|uniref:O-antigen ligase family protein n=1 Tax=Bradyrhizobium sp. 41S5 TaxID=1404443 RepID=UPI00156AE1BA|nr:O-antigen ligase family protein [Bradyrhizobium sp. 41S5]UFX46344.1 hypothetical protein HAP47_0006535 [Bradyrhizobium sp. 41S5]
MRLPVFVTENLAILRNLAKGGAFNAAGLGFGFYVIAICYPGIKATPAQLMDLRSGLTTQADVGGFSLFIAVPALLLGLLVFARHGAYAAIRRSQPILIFLLIYSGLIVLASVAGAEYIESSAQIVQYVITLGAFLLCLCFWQAPAQSVDDALAMGFLALAASLSAAAIVQGFHEYRWVGLIHPNHYARYAYIALVLHSLAVKRVSLPVFLICFGATYVVSARTIMIGTLLFYLGYLAFANYRALFSRAQQIMNVRMLAAFMMTLPVALVILSFFTDTDRLIDKVTNDLALFDPNRGVLSGFTGRTESWNVFFDTIDEYVFFGYGFRSSRYNLHAVHSGILSYFMDFGLLLGGLLLLVVAGRGLYLVWIGTKHNDRRTLLCGLAVATTLLIQWFEPDNFNIGFIGSFFFMLFLAYTPSARRRYASTRLRHARLPQGQPSLQPAADVS